MESHLDDDYSAFVAADMRFHQRIAGAAHNALLEDLLQSVRSLIRVWVERALGDSDHARLACAEHRAVLDALRAHDSDAAAYAIGCGEERITIRLLDKIAVGEEASRHSADKPPDNEGTE